MITDDTAHPEELPLNGVPSDTVKPPFPYRILASKK